MRGITLYDDKLFITMSDAHIVALDARNGKLVWDVPQIADGRGRLERSSCRPAAR